MAPNPFTQSAHSDSSGSSGLNTPEGFLEPLPIHPTAARRDIPIIVESANTVYSDNHITAKFAYRGSSVVNHGTHISVVPTSKPFEFKTERKIQRTGYVHNYLYFSCSKTFRLLPA